MQLLNKPAADERTQTTYICMDIIGSVCANAYPVVASRSPRKHDGRGGMCRVFASSLQRTHHAGCRHHSPLRIVSVPKHHFLRCCHCSSAILLSYCKDNLRPSAMQPVPCLPRLHQSQGASVCLISDGRLRFPRQCFPHHLKSIRWVLSVPTATEIKQATNTFI